jgi:hypothetical protein
MGKTLETECVRKINQQFKGIYPNMPPTLEEKIHQKAIEILSKRKRGLRHTKLVNEVKKNLPAGTSEYTISTYVQKLDQSHPKEVYRPARGLFKHTNFREEQEKPEKEKKVKVKIKEEDYYNAFADYLMGELGECSKAIPLGGKKFRDKWGTPDVIGVEKSREHDPVKHPDVIVSAEIKFDSTAQALITAFGQACAYKAFSHKVYLLIPKESDDDDVSRIESLCMIFGIGLILFDSTAPTEPQWEIKTRPVKTDPDYFYLNQNAEKIKETGLFD